MQRRVAETDQTVQQLKEIISKLNQEIEQRNVESIKLTKKIQEYENTITRDVSIKSLLSPLTEKLSDDPIIIQQIREKNN